MNVYDDRHVDTTCDAEFLVVGQYFLHDNDLMLCTGYNDDTGSMLSVDMCTGHVVNVRCGAVVQPVDVNIHIIKNIQGENARAS